MWSNIILIYAANHGDKAKETENNKFVAIKNANASKDFFVVYGSSLFGASLTPSYI